MRDANPYQSRSGSDHHDSPAIVLRNVLMILTSYRRPDLVIHYKRPVSIDTVHASSPSHPPRAITPDQFCGMHTRWYRPLAQKPHIGFSTTAPEVGGQFSELSATRVNVWSSEACDSDYTIPKWPSGPRNDQRAESRMTPPV
jgi:hypothetical protein